jgi:hypothetical protein
MSQTVANLTVASHVQDGAWHAKTAMPFNNFYTSGVIDKHQNLFVTGPSDSWQ